MKIDGQCHCGEVRYEAEIDPADVSICHCTDCQTLTGSPFRVTVLTARANIHLAGTPPKVYTKTGESGRKRRQYFCRDCGTPLFTAGEGDDAAVWGIRWGSIQQRRQLAPQQQIWCRSAVPWLETVPNLPHHETE